MAVAAQFITLAPQNVEDPSALEMAGAAVKQAYGPDLGGRETWLRCVEEMIVIFNMFLSVPPDPTALASTPLVSSAGILEQYLACEFVAADQRRRVTVRDMHLQIGNNTRELGVYPYTWDDQLHINYCYNDAYYDENLVDEFLAYTTKALEHGLDISLQQL